MRTFSKSNVSFSEKSSQERAHRSTSVGTFRNNSEVKVDPGR
jgi:hypothetical protein